MSGATNHQPRPVDLTGVPGMPGKTGDRPRPGFGSVYQIRRSKIGYYRRATDTAVLLVLLDQVSCPYANLHRAIDFPFARREAIRRGLL